MCAQSNVKKKADLKKTTEILCLPDTRDAELCPNLSKARRKMRQACDFELLYQVEVLRWGADLQRQMQFIKILIQAGIGRNSSASYVRYLSKRTCILCICYFYRCKEVFWQECIRSSSPGRWDLLCILHQLGMDAKCLLYKSNLLITKRHINIIIMKL